MNYYEVREKKPEHGGGWAFMAMNRREGTYIRCRCGAGGWEKPGHATPEEAEQCFYEDEKSRGSRWSTQTNATRCAICDDWTPDILHAVSNLIDPTEYVCTSHFDTEGEADEWLWTRHPFKPGIKIMASW